MFASKEQACAEMGVERVETTFDYRRQSMGSVTVVTASGDSTNALSVISDMLATYNEMIEANANAIKENAIIRDQNAAMTRSTLESIIEVINEITRGTLVLDAATRKNAQDLVQLKDETISVNNMMVHSRLDELQVGVQANARDILTLKEDAKSCADSINNFGKRLGRLEDRILSIERWFRNHRKHYKNDASAKMA